MDWYRQSDPWVRNPQISPAPWERVLGTLLLVYLGALLAYLVYLVVTSPGNLPSTSMPFAFWLVVGNALWVFGLNVLVTRGTWRRLSPAALRSGIYWLLLVLLWVESIPGIYENATHLLPPHMVPAPDALLPGITTVASFLNNDTPIIPLLSVAGFAAFLGLAYIALGRWNRLLPSLRPT